MSIKRKQIVLGVLAATGLYVGIWAAAWPSGFFGSFPGLGREWVSALPPYNEHLVRDVGGMYLAFGVASLWLVVRPSAQGIVGVGLGWLTFNLIHAAFHLDHLRVYSRFDQVLNVVALVGVAFLSFLLVLPARQSPRAAD